MTALRMLFIMDPLERVDVDHDTTFVFMLEAHRREHQVFWCTMDDLIGRAGAVDAWATQVSLRHERGAHYENLSAKEQVSVGDMDVVFVRTDPPFDRRYLFTTNLLSLFDDGSGPLVVNGPRGLRDAQEHLYPLRFPELTPKTLVSSQKDALLGFLTECDGGMVIKPIDGHGGEGVLLAREEDPNLSTLLEMSTDGFTTGIVAQQFIPEIKESGDVRVLLLDGEVLGACARVPKSGELRGNLHAGASEAPYELTGRDLEVCAVVGKALAKDGLYFSGIDLIGGYLTEVNVTSPTVVQEVNRLYGLQLESKVIDFVEAKVSERRS